MDIENLSFDNNLKSTRLGLTGAIKTSLFQSIGIHSVFNVLQIYNYACEYIF